MSPVAGEKVRWERPKDSKAALLDSLACILRRLGGVTQNKTCIEWAKHTAHTENAQITQYSYLAIRETK